MVRQGKDVLKNPFDYMTEQKWRNTIKIVNVCVTEIVDFLKRVSGTEGSTVCFTVLLVLTFVFQSANVPLTADNINSIAEYYHQLLNLFNAFTKMIDSGDPSKFSVLVRVLVDTLDDLIRVLKEYDILLPPFSYRTLFGASLRILRIKMDHGRESSEG